MWIPTLLISDKAFENLRFQFRLSDVIVTFLHVSSPLPLPTSSAISSLLVEKLLGTQKIYNFKFYSNTRYVNGLSVATNNISLFWEGRPRRFVVFVFGAFSRSRKNPVFYFYGFVVHPGRRIMKFSGF